MMTKLDVISPKTFDAISIAGRGLAELRYSLRMARNLLASDHSETGSTSALEQLGVVENLLEHLDNELHRRQLTEQIRMAYEGNLYE